MADREAACARILAQLSARPTHPHVALSVERGDDSVVFSSGDTPWFTASIDKIMTAAVVMQLQEEGLLSIEDRLLDHLPPDLLRGIHILDRHDHLPSLTLRHLLSHGSGLADWLEDRPAGGIRVVDSIVTHGDRTIGLADALDLVRRMTPHFVPRAVHLGGHRVRYSNTNYLLLNAIIEARTGRTLDQAFRERLFLPLDMQHTWMAGGSSPTAITRPAAPLWFGRSPLHIDAFLASIHSVYSTGPDLIRLLRGLVKGQLLRHSHAWTTMTTTFNRFGLPTDRAALRAPGWPIEYGLGVKRFVLPAWLPPFRRLPVVLGHTGSTGSWLFHCPALDVYLAGTVNQGHAGAVPFRVVPRLLRALAD